MPGTVSASVFSCSALCVQRIVCARLCLVSLRFSAAYVLELGPGKESKVIPGLEEGVASMRQGGKRVLLIPPQLGYGAHGVPDFLVPPGATLLYYLEHLGRASVDGDATPTPTPTPLYPTPIPTPDPPKPWEVGGEGQVVYPHGTPSSAPNSEL